MSPETVASTAWRTVVRRHRRDENNGEGLNAASAKIAFVLIDTFLSASRGAHSPVRGHPRGSKVVPLNSWGRVSY